MISQATSLNNGGPPLAKGMPALPAIVDKTGKFNRLQPTFQKQLRALAQDFYKAYQEPLILTDTVRTRAEQAKAHLEKPALALPAGHPNAMHPRGLAVDVDLGQSRLITPEMLAKNGLHLPALNKGETWHLEPLSTSAGGTSACSTKSYGKPRSLLRADLFSPSPRGTLKSSQQSRPAEPLTLMKQQDMTRQAASADRPRLLQAALEIEAIFLEQLMGQMRRAMVDPLSPSHRKLRGYLSMADQQLARSLAASGGLGLAERILGDLALPDSYPKTENRHEGSTPTPGQTGPPTGDTLV